MLELSSEDDALMQLNAAIAELQQQITYLQQENMLLTSKLETQESQLKESQNHVIELQEALERLAASEEQFRTLFEISGEGLFYTEVDPPCPIDLPIDEQCEWLYQNIRVAKANPAFAAMYGVENPDELIGLKNSDVHVEGSEKNTAFIRTQIENGYRIRNYETEEIDRQGRRRYFLNNGVGIIKEGYAIGAWASQIDITELRETQHALLETEQKRTTELEQINLELRQTLEQLAESEERFRMLFELSGEGFYYIEIDPPCPIDLPIEEQCKRLYRDIRVTKANAAFAAMYGVDDPEEMVGTRNGDVHVPDSDKNAAFIRETIKDGYSAKNLETEEIDRQGRLHYFLNNGAYTIKDGYLVGGWGTQVDITELKETQQALLATEQKRVAELAKINAEILEREREKAVLLSISQTIATVRDRYDLLQLIIKQIKPLFNFYDCAIPLIKDGKYFCRLSDLTLNMSNPTARNYLYEVGFNSEAGTSLRSSGLQRLINETEATGRPLIVEYEQDWTGYSDAHLLEAYQHLGYKEGLFAVLKASGEVLGCFVINSLEKSFFPPEQFTLFQAVADQVAVAIANMQANEAVLAHEKALQRIEQERADELEQRVQERTAELEQLSAELEERVQERTLQLAQTVARLNEEITTRQQIAGEIHDTLAQTFTGISVQLELAQFLMHQNLAEVETILGRISELTQIGLTEARRSVWALHSTSDDYADLEQNLSRSVERMTQGTSIDAEITISGTPYLLPSFIGKNLLRIGQEAITNVLKHAQATRLWVDVTYLDNDVVLCIRDNGYGFLPQGTTNGFGLIGMSERADRINGQLTITSQPGNGTEILVRASARGNQS
ncbi:PAS domain S-box protein [Oscillatoria sp. FACHB-1407]|uniref:PAS domain S-box protein n=1 Tax=Oscillatoria sp. FACHB-1407 TaxID=2692847 RepID=UPI001684322D|nr:PAS domain S-box protein [Oscillatoria sp. FACHB-1407]MBD2465220.1 PAS domain S-box protein [Oscillatoria sp. FACHB-1407]